MCVFSHSLICFFLSSVFLSSIGLVRDLAIILFLSSNLFLRAFRTRNEYPAYLALTLALAFTRTWKLDFPRVRRHVRRVLFPWRPGPDVSATSHAFKSSFSRSFDSRSKRSILPLDGVNRLSCANSRAYTCAHIISFISGSLLFDMDHTIGVARLQVTFTLNFIFGKFEFLFDLIFDFVDFLLRSFILKLLFDHSV